MDWPAQRSEVRDWTPRGRQGNRADRTLRDVRASLPPLIGELPCDLVGDVARAHESAVIAVVCLEAGYGQHLAPLADFLLRSESVASSKIERIDAGWRAFGKAFAGGKGSDDAQAQLAAVRALADLVESADTGPISLPAILKAHRVLMAPDPYADVQVRFGSYRTGSAVATSHRSGRSTCLRHPTWYLRSSTICWYSQHVLTCRSWLRPRSRTRSSSRSTPSPTATDASGAR